MTVLRTQLSQERINSINALTNRFVGLMQRFERCGKVYGVDLTQQRDQGMELFVKGEIHFSPAKGERGSMDLDDKWSEWAADLSSNLEDAALDLDFTAEKDMLREFLRALSENRSLLL